MHPSGSLGWERVFDRGWLRSRFGKIDPCQGSLVVWIAKRKVSAIFDEHGTAVRPLICLLKEKIMRRVLAAKTRCLWVCCVFCYSPVTFGVVEAILIQKKVHTRRAE